MHVRDMTRRRFLVMVISCASFASMTEALQRELQVFPGIIPASFI